MNTTRRPAPSLTEYRAEMSATRARLARAEAATARATAYQNTYGDENSRRRAYNRETTLMAVLGRLSGHPVSATR